MKISVPGFTGTVPTGATFDPKLRCHWSRQAGDAPRVTVSVRG